MAAAQAGPLVRWRTRCTWILGPGRVPAALTRAVRAGPRPSAAVRMGSAAAAWERMPAAGPRSPARPAAEAASPASVAPRIAAGEPQHQPSRAAAAAVAAVLAPAAAAPLIRTRGHHSEPPTALQATPRRGGHARSARRRWEAAAPGLVRLRRWALGGWAAAWAPAPRGAAAARWCAGPSA